MKIIIKEINKNTEYLVYLATDDGVNVSCELTTKDELESTVIKYLTDRDKPLPVITYDYEKYKLQDEQNK